MSLQITGVLVATSISVFSCLSLVGCGQKGNLYLPTTSPAGAGVMEKRNENSNFIFGGSKKETAPVPQAVTGSAS